MPRPQLFARIDEARAAGRPLWIVAPAGSGKTALLASFCHEREIESIWYRFDESDADPGGFLHYFARALHAHLSDRGRAGKASDPSLANTPAAQRVFLRELLTQIPERTLVVFDDHHAVPAEAAVHALFALVLQEITTDVTVAITSRNLPEGVLARAFANGSLISRDEMRLAAAEAHVIARGMGIAEAALVERALALSQGWASGLILLLRSAERMELPAPGSLESPRLVSDFLAAEVFPQLEEHEKALLKRCAFLPVVTPGSAMRLSDRQDAAMVLRQLHERQLFIDRLRDSDAYVFHPLLRGFLAQEAQSTLAAGELDQLKIVSADIMEETGDDGELPELLAGAAAWDKLVAFIERNAQRLVIQGRNATLESCIRRLPAEVLDRSPWCRYWLGICVAHRDMTAAQEHFEAARAKMIERGDNPGASDASRAALDALFWQWGERSPQTQSFWGEAIAEVLGRAHRLLPQFRGLLFGGFAMLTSDPAHSLTRGLIKQAETLYRESASAALRTQAATMLVAAYNIRGDHPQASAIVAEAAPLGDSDEVPLPIRLYWQTGIALQQWYIDGNPDAALRTAERALELVRLTGASSFEHFLLTQRGLAHVLRGELDEAERVYQVMRRTSQGNRRMEMSREQYLLGWVQMERGELDAACETFRSSLALIERLALFFAFAVQHRFALIQGLLAARRFEQALEEIGKAHQAAERAQSAWFRWQALMAQSEALLGLGRDSEADHALAGALVLGRMKGILSIPLMSRDRLAAILDRAFTRGIETEFVQKLAARHGVRPMQSESDRWPWPVRVYTFGHFEVVVDDAPLRFGRKAQQRPLDLLKALIASGGRDVPASALADTLWPDADGDAAEKTLGITLLRLRRLLRHDDVLQVVQRKLSLNEAMCWTDVQALERFLKRIDDALEETAAEDLCAMAEQLFDLYQGPFLTGEDEQPPVLAARARLRQRVASATLRIARALDAVGHTARGLSYCRALIERDPSTEHALDEWIEAAAARSNKEFRSVRA